MFARWSYLMSMLYWLSRSQSAIANVYQSVLGRLARRGYRRPPSATPREHAAEVQRRTMPGAADYAQECFCTVFGG